MQLDGKGARLCLLLTSSDDLSFVKVDCAKGEVLTCPPPSKHEFEPLLNEHGIDVKYFVGLPDHVHFGNGAKANVGAVKFNLNSL